MKISIISLTSNGGRLALSLAQGLTGEISLYCFEKYPVEGGKSFSKIGDAAKEAWECSDGIIFICACGIAVRAIAPLIRSKISDPAVVSIDEQGRFAVSLLSGHIGGANRLAEQTAEILDAVPVITTATDSGGKFSPDMFAKENGLAITDMTMAKEIAAASVRGEMIGFADMLSGRSANINSEYGVCVSCDKNARPFEHTLVLMPKNIVIGAGCRKNISPEILEKHILSCLEAEKIDIRRICALATIDIKRDEPAMRAFAKKYNIPLRVFSAAELSCAEGDFSSSAFVMEKTGTDNVCERSAVLCGAKILCPKKKGDGVTCALAELPVNIPLPENL